MGWEGLRGGGEEVVVLVEGEGERWGLPWTGPRERRDCAKTGSAASRLMAERLVRRLIG